MFPPCPLSTPPRRFMAQARSNPDAAGHLNSEGSARLPTCLEQPSGLAWVLQVLQGQVKPGTYLTEIVSEECDR